MSRDFRRLLRITFQDKGMASNQEPIKENRESSIRWQGRTIEQFGYALNLILGLAVAALGFELSLVLGDGLKPYGWSTCLIVISVFSLLLSIALGLLCVVTRLRDFRATAETARRREDEVSDSELHFLRTLAHELGQRSWLLLWWQIWTFGLGILLLVITVGNVIAKAL